MSFRMSLPLTAVVALGALGIASAARADEIKVFSSVAMRAVIEELAPRFERDTPHRIVATFGLAAQLKARIESGEAYDVAILTPAQIDDLIEQGKAAQASRVMIAQTGLGLMTKAGAPPLDVRTVEAFKTALTSASSVTYVPAGASGALFRATAERLGIAAALEPKTKPAASVDEVIANVRNGIAEIAVMPVSEILPVQGAALGGVFPAEVQAYIAMAGGSPATAPQGARDFLALLTAPSNDAVITAKGMERVPR